MPAHCYIIFSQKLNRFYTGASQDEPTERIKSTIHMLMENIDLQPLLKIGHFFWTFQYPILPMPSDWNVLSSREKAVFTITT